MFYNTYRSTKSAFQRRQNSSNPRSYLLNQPKRQKLKNLLMSKFIQKYNIKDPDEYLDLVLTQFIQNEKLNDTDLKRLDLKIKKLNKEFKNKSELKTDLENIYQKPIKTEVNSIIKDSTINQTLNDNNINTELNNNKNIQNPQNKIRNLKNEFPSLNTYSSQISKTESNIKKRGHSSYNNNRTLNTIKTPEEELAELEKELKEEELLENKNRYKRIDFTYQGDEWAAIVNYNKNLYKRQILEDKLKELEVQRRTKECLDIQIKEKLKKKLDEESQEKQFDEKIKKYTQTMDEMYETKNRKICEQIHRLKTDRDAILKAQTMRKKIEDLKEKKFEKNLVKKYKEQLEQDRQDKINRKKKGKEDLLKAKKDIEEKQKRLKEKALKEKEEDKKINQLRNLIDQRKENERKYYYDKIKANSNKYYLPYAQSVLKKLEKEKKEEEEKIQYHYDEKNRHDFEKEYKAKLKRLNDKIEMKKFLDMQIAEKNKEKNFNKLLDQEQARIWKIDLKKRYDEMNKEKECIKKMNRKNFECILKQIEQKKRSKSNKNIMTENEYAMNRNLLEKANEDYLRNNNS
jgi:hypothetical protein